METVLRSKDLRVLGLGFCGLGLARLGFRGRVQGLGRREGVGEESLGRRVLDYP